MAEWHSGRVAEWHSGRGSLLARRVSQGQVLLFSSSACLQKPGKADLTEPSAFSPISLLSTLSKAIETVVAERIACLAEKFKLPPSNHYGALKRKSTIDALLTVQEKIFQAWKDKKILSLITFDLKGAFNSVPADVISCCLREHHVPEIYVRWIQEICSDRSAPITVNGTTSEPASLAHAGLPQGSPLSPLLFLFFNANLVKSVVNKRRGTIAFVDDYSAWVTGDSIADNLDFLQANVVGPLEHWAAQCGAIFRPDKSHMTHFTLNKKALQSTMALKSLTLNGVCIHPSPKLKLLGVVLDQKLKYHEHIGNAVKRGIAAVLALKRLRNLRPETARRLYSSTVTPVTDYASVIWAPNASMSVLKQLEKVQRIGCQAIVRAFKSVSLAVAESEASLIPIETRLLKQQLSTWIKWHSKPAHHRFWIIKRTICLINKRYISPLQRIAEKLKDLDLALLEKIGAFSKAPWVPSAPIVISSRESAIKRAINIDPLMPVAFADGSARNDFLGIGVQWGGALQWLAVSRTISSPKTLDSHAAELVAIDCAVSQLLYSVQRGGTGPPITIFSESLGALQRVDNFW